MADTKKVFSVIMRLILIVLCVLGVFQFIGLVNNVVNTGWNSVPYAVAGLVIGILLIVLTTIASYWDSKEFGESFSLTDIQQFGFFRTLGYVYGAVMIFSSGVWLITPSVVLRSLPAFKAMIPFYLLAPVFLQGGGMMFAAMILRFRESKFGALFSGVLGLVALGIVNSVIWNISELIRGDFYLFGKVFFVFIFILQILYIVAIHILPARQRNKQESRAG